MVKHAILLAEKELCEAAASGRIKVYDFREKRKRRINFLSPGSICVILTKTRGGQPQMFYGEFTVSKVREVDANEYNSLASKGLIYNPQSLGPNEKRWVIEFDEFREYKNKVPKRDLVDVKTGQSKKPIAEWAILGLTPIDDTALEGIRKKARGFVIRIEERIAQLEKRVSRIEGLLGVSNLQFPLTHECIELMLLELGRALGFKTYTADPSRKCGDQELSKLTDLSPNNLPLADRLKNVDVIWSGHNVYYLFEVVLTTDLRTSLLKFAEAAGLNAKYYIVSDSDKELFEKVVGMNIFNQIRDRTCLINLHELLKYYYITKLWRSNIDIFKLPYLTT